MTSIWTLDQEPRENTYAAPCDKTVNWEERGVICETCDQWYRAGCQNIHTLSYDQLGDAELNISWHVIICNNPNYSYTVHDYQSIEITSSLSNNNILDIYHHRVQTEQT